ELAGAHRHYTAGLARTMQLGRKPKKVADVGAAVLEGVDAVLETMAPGVVAQGLEGAWRKINARAGLKKEFRIGYSIGIGYAPDWGEHTISLRQGDMTVLQPGNTLHAIMGMWMDGWGIEISETILVTPNGCETLTKLPREIHHKP